MELAYEYEEDEEPWRQWWRVGCGGFLALVLVVGLFLSLRPDRDGATEVAGGDDGGPGETAATEGGPAPTEADGADADAGADAGTEDAEAEEEARREELIEAARSPEETTVQVLDGGGGSATDDAAAVLAELGYDVVATNPSRTDVAVTTVLYTDGSKAEAEALRARDERFAEVSVNDRLSDAVDIHVIVGSDWSD